MSRIGKSPISVPNGVKVTVQERTVFVEGPKGKLKTPLPKGISVDFSDNQLVASRANDSKQLRALHGLTRALLNNSVTGVSQGFSKSLDLVGIGYRADAKGSVLNLSLGFSHPVEMRLPEGIKVSVTREPKPISNYVGTITIQGADRQVVGQVAADIRGLRPPDAYKGKGLRYSDEVVRTKVGKKGA